METSLILCTSCKQYYNPRYLDQTLHHMHTGIQLDETIKGQVAEKRKTLICSIDQVAKISRNHENGCHLVAALDGRVFECVGDLFFEDGNIYTYYAFSEVRK